MSILLDTLSKNIDLEVLGYLNADENLRSNVEDYLLELLVNDDLLSTETFTTTSTSKRTLIEEIAELDLQLREINTKLALITNANRDLIIDINDDLHKVEETVSNEYGVQLEVMLKEIKNNHSLQVNEKLTNTINVNNSILTNIDSILDLLELPTLCRLCILQGNYQELLEISHLAKSLVIRYPKVSIFASINAQVEIELKLMVKGLVKLLNTNLKQNHIFKIFQILNKLETPQKEKSQATRNENSQKVQYLKSIYLNSRYKFILDEISHLNPFIKFNKLTYLKRFIEIYREYMFNSLSMYHSIFSKQNEEDIILVNEFIVSLTNTLIEEMKKYLPELGTDEDEIDSQAQKDGLILQLIYLCKSLTKFQVDFESVLISELVYVENLVSEDDWVRNLSKVKKFR